MVRIERLVALHLGQRLAVRISHRQRDQARVIGEGALQLAFERAAIVRGGGASQRGTQRDLRGLLAHQPFHAARQLLIQAERFIEVRAHVGDEEARGGLAHRALRQPDRGQQRNQRGQHDRERQATPNATGSSHSVALPRRAIALEQADQGRPGVEAEQRGQVTRHELLGAPEHRPERTARTETLGEPAQARKSRAPDVQPEWHGQARADRRDQQIARRNGQCERARRRISRQRLEREQLAEHAERKRGHVALGGAAKWR